MHLNSPSKPLQLLQLLQPLQLVILFHVSTRKTLILSTLFIGLLSFSVSFADIAELNRPEAESGTGSSRIEVRGEIIAGGKVDATIRVSVRNAMVTGAELLTCVHWQHNASLQHGESLLPGYVYLTGLPAGVEMERFYSTVNGVYGGLESPRRCPSFRVKAGTIPSGSSFMITIQEIELPLVAGARIDLPVFIRPFENQSLELLASDSRHTVSAAPASVLRLRTPASVAPGDEIETWVRLEDAFGNRAADRSLTLDLITDGTYQRRVIVHRAVEKVEGIQFDDPGIHEIEFRSGGGGLRASSGPIRVGYNYPRITWLDFQGTSTASDGLVERNDILRNREGTADLSIISDHHRTTESGTFAGQALEVEDSWQAARDGGSVLKLTDRNGRQIHIARPEQPTDTRWLTPATLKLVEVVSGRSVHLWLVRQLLAAGYSPGLVGTNHSHQFPGKPVDVFTAVVHDENQDWVDALAAGQTYVSFGERINVETSFSDIPFKGNRNLSISVRAKTPVASVRLYKNGVVLSENRGAQVANRVTMTLHSDSQPYGIVRSRPRNAREWIGYISVQNSPIDATANEFWQIMQGRTRIDFLVRTHGMRRSMVLDLSAADSAEVMEIVIARGFEDAAWLPGDRLPQNLPTQRFLVSVEEAFSGVKRDIRNSGYTDSLQFLPHYTIGQREASHRYVDDSPARSGDYYYYEVLLENGNFALTSPRVVSN